MTWTDEKQERREDLLILVDDTSMTNEQYEELAFLEVEYVQHLEAQLAENDAAIEVLSEQTPTRDELIKDCKRYAELFATCIYVSRACWAIHSIKDETELTKAVDAMDDLYLKWKDEDESEETDGN